MLCSTVSVWVILEHGGQPVGFMCNSVFNGCETKMLQNILWRSSVNFNSLHPEKRVTNFLKILIENGTLFIQADRVCVRVP